MDAFAAKVVSECFKESESTFRGCDKGCSLKKMSPVQRKENLERKMKEVEIILQKEDSKALGLVRDLLASSV